MYDVYLGCVFWARFGGLLEACLGLRVEDLDFWVSDLAIPRRMFRACGLGFGVWGFEVGNSSNFWWLRVLDLGLRCRVHELWPVLLTYSLRV